MRTRRLNRGRGVHGAATLATAIAAGGPAGIADTSAVGPVAYGNAEDLHRAARACRAHRIDNDDWEMPQTTMVFDLSISGARGVLGRKRLLILEASYILRFPRADREPLWVVCAVGWQERLDRGLIQVGFRFTAEITSREAA